MSGTPQSPPDDPCEADLSYLSHVVDMDWDVELARCEHLLALVPVSIGTRQLSARNRVSLLRVAMALAATRAYEEFGPTDRAGHIPASKVLAGAAAIGLVYQHPNKIEADLRVDGKKRNNLAWQRQSIAAEWHHSSTGPGNFIRRDKRNKETGDRFSYQDASFKSYRVAIADVLADDKALAGLIDHLVQRREFKLDQPIQILDRPESSKSVSPSTALSPTVMAAQRRFRGQYVSRAELEQGIVDLSYRHSVIMLVGDPGAGKTRIAYEVGRNLATSPDAFVFLRANTRETLLFDLLEDLSYRNIELEDLSDIRIRRVFAKLLKDRTIQSVVIDNLEEAELLEGLVPDSGGLPAKVLITARRRMPHPAVGDFCRIGPMREAEALQLISQQANKLTKPEVQELAAAFGNHPLGLVVATGFINSSEELTVVSLLDAMRRHPERILGSQASQEEVNILTLFSRILDDFQRHDDHKPEIILLEAISCLSSVGIPKSLLIAHYCNRVEEVPEPVHDVLCHRALNALEERSLIEINDKDVSLHAFARTAWRALFRDRLAATCTALDRLIRKQLRDAAERLMETCLVVRAANLPESGVATPYYELEDNKSESYYLLWDAHHRALREALQSAPQSAACKIGPVPYGTAMQKWLGSETEIATEMLQYRLRMQAIDKAMRKGYRLAEWGPRQDDQLSNAYVFHTIDGQVL